MTLLPPDPTAFGDNYQSYMDELHQLSSRGRFKPFAVIYGRDGKRPSYAPDAEGKVATERQPSLISRLRIKLRRK